MFYFGTPLRSAEHPPPTEIPFMDRPIIDPARHVPPPYSSNYGIPRQDLRRTLRNMPGNINPNDPPAHDDSFMSAKVVKLNSHNFSTFLGKQDAAMVLFYNDHCPVTAMMMDVFSEAAESTKRARHAYAGVDCRDDPRLCHVNKVRRFPAMRLYSRDYCVGEVRDKSRFTAHKARRMVEHAPYFEYDFMDNVET